MSRSRGLEGEPAVEPLRTGYRWLFSILGGVGAGVALLAVLLIWRGAQADALVIDVQPAGSPSEMRVWVGGAVVAPGLVAIERGSRVADAVALAGGLTPDADTSTINMARPLEDAQHIEIPSRAPTPAPGAAHMQVQTQAQAGQVPLTGAPEDSTPAADSPAGAPMTGGLINLNTATAAELEALPEIGATLAQRIVDYRVNQGPFTSVDDLEAINGISMRIVDILRPLVTVGP